MVNEQGRNWILRNAGDFGKENQGFGIIVIVEYNSFIYLVGAMIHWTRQIKEVLNSQHALETSENAGPLEEIEFWRSRSEDLSGISDQLHQPGVMNIQSILVQSKSSYVAPFRKLSKLIQVCFYTGVESALLSQ